MIFLFSKPRMYADDTTLTLSAEDPLVLDQRKNYRNQFQWLCVKKLTLNVKKTKFMVFGSHYKLSYIDNNFSVKARENELILSWLKSTIHQ